MPMKLRYTDRVMIRLECNMASRMDGALRDGETRADFIRQAIDDLIERRLAAATNEE
jgi:metal-responsive CopG/Arc/MetJ family transcriptional regulator